MSDLEPAKTGPIASCCAVCQAPIQQAYFNCGAVVICPGCREKIPQPKLGRFPAFARALLFGGGAALLSAILSFAISYFSGYELAIVWIFLGAAIGGCVHKGNEARGGWGYSLLGLSLTYIAIGLSLSMVVFVEMGKDHSGDANAESPVSSVQSFLPSLKTNPRPHLSATPAPKSSPGSVAIPTTDPGASRTRFADLSVLGVVILALMFGVAVFVLPVAICVSSPISIVIYGFGMHAAWKACRAVPLVITGPFQLAGAPPNDAGS